MRLTPRDRAIATVSAGSAAFWLLSRWWPALPVSGFAGFLALVTAIYLSVRLLSWARRQLLWSLRSRLAVAYLLIAVVPVLLLLTMAGISAYLIYAEIGAYLLHSDLQRRIEKLASTANAISMVLSARPASSVPAQDLPSVRALLTSVSEELPGIQFSVQESPRGEAERSGIGKNRFSGIVQSGDRLQLRAEVVETSTRGRGVTLAVPITPEFLETLAPDLGPLQVTVTRLAGVVPPGAVVLRLGERQYLPIELVSTRRRVLPPAAHWLDYEISWLSNLEAVVEDETGRPGLAGAVTRHPVFVAFAARPSQLNRRLFASLGELADWPTRALIFVGVIFLVLQVLAVRTGIRLTRSITRAVNELYDATQHVQAGDFSHRVRVQEKDQLGVLGDSFNAMTNSIDELIREQRLLQRLESEIVIAQQVQAELFPRTLPELPGVELAAACRAARMVSGDFYDFIRLGPTQLGIAIADISGKGLSSALLMASLQAALRSHAIQDGSASQHPADLVRRMNRHLYHNTSEEKYATFFYAVYDTESRLLRYTNAGHLPPICLNGDRMEKLEEGGLVVGLFEECEYMEGEIHLEPGSLLVGYSDGLTEPENVYGEEFGRRRLVDQVMRNRTMEPKQLVDALLEAADEWGGSPEQSDDMTIIVARTN